MKKVNTATEKVHKVGTPKEPCAIQISMYWPMKNIGQWHLRHIKMPQRLDRFAFQSLKMENNKMYAIWSLCRVCNDHCISTKRPTAMKVSKLKFLMESMVKQETCSERCMTTCGRAGGTRAKMRSRAREEASAQEVRGEAKHLEYRSCIDNAVFDLVDLRKVKPKNMWPEGGCSPSRRTSKVTSSRQRPDGY